MTECDTALMKAGMRSSVQETVASTLGTEPCLQVNFCDELKFSLPVLQRFCKGLHATRFMDQRA